MAHHHHHHHHHHHDDHDEGGPLDGPLDAASQSLSNALRASFGILKIIMLILVVLYLFSNVRSIGGHEEALVLRLGRLLPGVRDAGLVWAFPYPLDEIVRLPTRKVNEMTIDSHSFHRRPNEVGKSLTYIVRGDGGLHPTLDGALLTADAGLVHVQWKISYKIENVQQYVRVLSGTRAESLEERPLAAEKLIEALVETAGIHVAAQMTAEEITWSRVDYARTELQRLVNLRLAALDSGIVLHSVEMFESTPPIAVRDSFTRTQQAENQREKRIRDARNLQSKMLSESAGAIYPQLVAALDARDAGESGADEEVARLLDLAEGEVGQMVKDAEAYFSVVVGRMRSDVETYRALEPEYERNASMLIERLWEETKTKIYRNPAVTKIYRPPGIEEFRVTIPPDPEQSRFEEAAKLKEEKFDIDKIRPKHYVPVGPEYD